MTLFSETTTIPLTKLAPAAQNVRKTAREDGIGELAASIAAHGLLNPLTVIAACDGKGEPTGKYGVIAGGRRLAALKLLAKRKALPRAAPIPCVIAEAAQAEELSLAENVTQAPMHPADQYEAFAKLHAQGLSAEDIAARFGLPQRTVQQRLRLGAASPKILAAYRDATLSLDQVMAFCVTDDHARQETVLDGLSPWQGNPSTIRRTITQTQVSLNDRRARFIGAEAYEGAGGVIARDLFSDDGDGYCEDAALLDRLVMEKLAYIAEEVRREGWRWVEITLEYDYRLTAAMRRVYPQSRVLTEEQEEAVAALEAEYDTLDEAHPEFDSEIERLEQAVETLRGPESYAAEDIACGGAFISLGYDGARIERGFIRPQDEIAKPSQTATAQSEDGAAVPIGGSSPMEADEGENAGPLPASLIADLSAWRSAALRDGLATNPDLAYRAVVHALATTTFYPYNPVSCLELRVTSAYLAGHATGLNDGVAQQAIQTRHEAWAARLPRDANAVWDFVANVDALECAQLLAHCAALTLNALALPHERKAFTRHADQLAAHMSLDMTASWEPTAERILNRITKAQILEAVAEAVDASAARRIGHLKKPEMVKAAETLLSGTGWLPEPLRMGHPEPCA